MVLRDPRACLALIENNSVDIEGRCLNQREDPIANGLQVFRGVKRFDVGTRHGEFVTKIEQAVCNRGGPCGDGANREMCRPVLGKFKIA
jgi:hypothetical protein